MTADELRRLKKCQPVITPDGPGLAQEIVLLPNGERRLLVSVRRADPTGKVRPIWRNYPPDVIELEIIS